LSDIIGTFIIVDNSDWNEIASYLKVELFRFKLRVGNYPRYVSDLDE